MKKQKIIITALLLYMIFLSIASISFAWLCNIENINPSLSFSAGAPEEYSLYKITCENDSSVHDITEIETVGTDGFSASDLQFGKISNLSILEHSNYIYYAIKIPKNDGGSVSLGIGYGDTDSDGDHFKIYVPSRDQNGDIEKEADGSIKTLLFEDEASLENIKKIEPDNSSTFIFYTCALSEKSPDDCASIDEVEELFAGKEAKSMNAFDEGGAPIPNHLTFDVSSAQQDYYYAYIKLEPNVSLYKHFIEHLWNNMPFFLAYEIRVTLDVSPEPA